ncbi:Melibiose operon regulatory protein [subsurface metagenome]
MDILFQHLTTPIDSSFNTFNVKLPHFIVPWHYHPEIEIMYVLKGEGTRFVGDNVENFLAGDFVLIGSNTPHVWRNDKRYYENREGLYAECLVLFFTPQTFGDAFLSSPEMSGIKKMLKEAWRGIKFRKKETFELKELMVEIFDSEGAERMLKVLQLLHKMSQHKHTRYLCSLGYHANLEYRDFDRLNRCVEYLMTNFHEKIELNKVAEIANMTPNSFCRYFKKRTTKTFSEFLIELRIGRACQLLTKSNKKVIEIAFESGFNSLSNFNDHFSKTKKMSPRQYRLNNLSNEYYSH